MRPKRSFRKHIVEKHIRFCEGKIGKRYTDTETANKAIQKALESAGGMRRIVASMGRKKARKCLKAYMNFITGYDVNGNEFFGCIINHFGKGVV